MKIHPTKDFLIYGIYMYTLAFLECLMNKNVLKSWAQTSDSTKTCLCDKGTCIVWIGHLNSRAILLLYVGTCLWSESCGPTRVIFSRFLMIEKWLCLPLKADFETYLSTTMHACSMTDENLNHVSCRVVVWTSFLSGQVYLLLLKWPSIPPENAMELLHYKYADIAVRMWAVECLEELRYSTYMY